MDGLDAARTQGKTRAHVLAEGIAACGGPNADAIASVRNYIDRRFPGFAWAESWHAEIEGAKAALRIADGDATRQRGPALSGGNAGGSPSGALSQCDDPFPGAAPLSAVRLSSLNRARDFIAEIGAGDIEQAAFALAFLREFGSLEGLGPDIVLWGRLLAAVDGDVTTAERVLAVISELHTHEPAADVVQLERRAA